jgi:putative colanic acid biosynthesis glycosyltransferase
MKVLQINTTKNTSSTGHIAEDIGKKVIEQGYSSCIAFGRSSNPGPSVPIKIGNTLDQGLHVLFTRIFDTHGFHSTIATKKLINQIESIDPDIIHLHNLHGYYLNIKILFEYLAKISKPIVWTLHDCWPYTGHCCYYNRINCLKWKTECKSCNLSWLYPQSIIFDNSRNNFRNKKYFFNLPDNLHLTSVSKWLGSQIKQSFLKYRPLTIIYNGVDLSVFKPKNVTYLKQKLTLKKSMLYLEWRTYGLTVKASIHSLN